MSAINSNSGESAGQGFDVQRLVCVSAMLDSVEDPSLLWIKSEALQDFDIGYKDRVTLHQVKNTKMNISDINKYFSEWKDNSIKYPDKPFYFMFHAQAYPEKINHFIKIVNRFNEADELSHQEYEYDIKKLGLNGSIEEWLESFEFRMLPEKNKIKHFLKLDILHKLRALYGGEKEENYYLDKMNNLVSLLEEDPPVFISATTLISRLGLNAVPNSSRWRRKYSKKLPQVSEDLHNLGSLVAKAFDDNLIIPDPSNPLLFITNPYTYYDVDSIIPSLIFYEKAAIPFFGDMFKKHTSSGGLKYYQSGGIYAKDEDYKNLNTWTNDYGVLSFIDMSATFKISDQILNEVDRIAEKLSSLQFPATGTGCMCNQAMANLEIQMELEKEIDLIKTLQTPLTSIPSDGNIRDLDEARYKDTYHQVLITIQEFAISNLISKSNGTQYSDWKTSPILEFVHHRHLRKRKKLAGEYVKSHFFSSLGNILPTFSKMELDDVMEIREKYSDFLPPIRREISRISRTLAQSSVQDDIEIQEEVNSFINDQLLPDIQEFNEAITRSGDKRMNAILLQDNSKTVNKAGMIKTPFTNIQNSLRLLSKDHLPGYRSDYLFFLQMLNSAK